jgi:hypothetical protein
MAKRFYKHAKTGAIQYLDDKVAAYFKDWQPTEDTPPCKDDYKFESEFICLESPAVITEAGEPVSETSRKRKRDKEQDNG